MHHVQKYTRAILPHAALCHSTTVHSINKNQFWWGMGASVTNRFSQGLSTALATASSQHALSIILNTFCFSPNSCHICPTVWGNFCNIEPLWTGSSIRVCCDNTLLYQTLSGIFPQYCTLPENQDASSIVLADCYHPRVGIISRDYLGIFPFFFHLVV